VFKKLALCLSATAALASSACTIDVQGSGIGQQVSTRELRRIQLTGNPHVIVRTFDGSIELRSSDQNEILVDIERRAATLEEAKELIVVTSEESGDVVIEAKRPRRSDDWIHLGGWTSPSVRLTVTLPRELEVQARTGDGTIDAHDLSGRVELRTGDGSIRLQRIQGDITASTGDGSVMGRELQGTVAVATGDGSVEMSGRFAALKARTGDGSIGIDAQPGSTMQSGWTITTGDGGVMLRLPKEFDADVQARTGDGSITTSGITVLTPPRQDGEPRRNIVGRIGTGGEQLTVRTGDGSIDLVAR
jgi:DUF4097 and DUF4098 domain-containing protein YvlB